MARKNDVIDVETPVVDVQCKTLFDRVCDYLKEKIGAFAPMRTRAMCRSACVYVMGLLALSFMLNATEPESRLSSVP